MFSSVYHSQNSRVHIQWKKRQAMWTKRKSDKGNERMNRQEKKKSRIYHDDDKTESQMPELKSFFVCLRPSNLNVLPNKRTLLSVTSTLISSTKIVPLTNIQL